MTEIILLMIFLFTTYSALCAPTLVFRLFPYRDSDEYAVFYLLACIVLGFSGIAGIAKIYQLVKNRHLEES